MVGILEQLRDRFVAAEAAGWGRILTPCITFSGTRLELNTDCGAQGEMRVEIRDRANGVLPGFSMADCDPVDLNSLRAVVRWRGVSDLRQFAGVPIRLHFRLRKSRLYSFRFP